jgi:hypothetical protein
VVFDLGWKSMLISALVIWYISQRDKPVYLIDFAVFEPPEDWKLNHDELMDIMGKQGIYIFIRFEAYICKHICIHILVYIFIYGR